MKLNQKVNRKQATPIVLAIIMITSMVMTFGGCGSSEKKDAKSSTTSSTADSKSEATTTPTTTAPTEETPAAETEAPSEKKVESINLEIPDGKYVFKKAEKVTDYEGKPALVVYFDWTNSSGKNTIDMTFHSKIFQNGVECDVAIVTNDIEAINNATKEIQDGTTIEVAHAFALQDETSPVTLEVSELISFDDNYQEQEISLQ